MIAKFLHSFCVLLIFNVFVNTAWANLMIAPHRILFEERQRSATVHLINTSDKTTTYRLGWLKKKQGINGKYIDLPSDNNEIPDAALMLRFSPRQVTLAPGENQTIRIALRRKKVMKSGEYRSHLSFQALPSKEVSDAPDKGSGFKINVIMSFSIPVIVRQGKLDTSVKISNIELSKTYNKKKNTTHYLASISLNKSGAHSSIGSLIIMWKPNGHPGYIQIGILNNVVNYPEISLVNFSIGLTDFKIGSGIMKVIYKGRKEYEGRTFDEIQTSISPSDFKSEIID